MKLLVVLESHFYVDKDNTVWCDRIIDYNYIKRYLNVFENVIVCGRSKKSADKPKSFDLVVSGPNVEFRELPDFVGIKGILFNYFKINKLIYKYSLEADAVIYRVPTPISLFSYKSVLKAKKVLAAEFMFAADKMIQGKGFVKSVINHYISGIAKKVCLKANGVSYVTERVLQEKYPCRATISGETKEYFTSNYSSIELKKDEMTEMNWSKEQVPETFNIIHTGYMDNYRKGQHTLSRGLKKVIDRGSVKLTLIGDGKKKDEFEQLVKELEIEDKVNFLGLITDRKTIFDNLRNSHLFVFPTMAEGLPRTIIEAMSVGLPCISSPVDGIPELLEEDFLVPFDDIEGYADKVIELITDWDKMISISDRNYNEAKKYEKAILDEKRKTFYTKIYKLSEDTHE